ncbi:MAG: hypothetical protein JW808_05925, partial [Victivallales bacterium]|nr:hypothetical protein [Victivallales bacterium]
PLHSWNDNLLPHIENSSKRLELSYDNWNLVATFSELSGSPPPRLSDSYLHGEDLSGSLQNAGGVGGLLAVSDLSDPSDPSYHLPAYDGNGNIMAYVDASTGAKAAEYEYSPSGVGKHRVPAEGRQWILLENR